MIRGIALTALLFGCPLYAQVTPTSLTLTASPGAAKFGQRVTLTATIDPPPAKALGLERVSFMAGGILLGVATVSAGSNSASITTTLLPAGRNSVQACYTGYPGIHAASTSAPLVYIVTAVPGKTFVYAPNVTVGGPAFPTFAGSGQSALNGAPFASPPLALVKDEGGNAVANASVTFNAPASGAGGMFANGLSTLTTATNAAGVASTTFTANGAAGSYSVTAMAAGVAGAASFSLTNLKPPVLTVTLSHVGSFTQGQSGAMYTVTVGNLAGAGNTTGTVTLTEALPAGLTLVSMSGGASWNCSLPPACTTANVLNAGAIYPPIAVVVNVAGNAGPTVVNMVSAAGGGSASAAGSDPTQVFSSCDLNQDGSTNVTDVQGILNQAMGVSAAGGLNVANVQLAINAALGSGCQASSASGAAF